MEEIWKDIKGYEGLYQVSNLGRVRSLDREVYHMNMGVVRKHIYKGKELRTFLEKDGYVYLFLYKDKRSKKYSIHRLVAENFILNSNNLPIINHKDEDKTNNIASNLEWCDYSYNNTYNSKHIKIGLKHRGWKPTSETRLKMSQSAKNRNKKGSI